MQAVRRVGLVQHHLARAIRHWPHEVGDGPSEPARRRQDLLAVLDGPVVAEDQREDGHALGRGQQPAVGLRLVGQPGAEVAVEAQHLAGLVQRVDHEPAQDLRHRMEPIFEGRDDAEVAAAAPQRPEEIGVLRRAGLLELAVRRHHVGGEQVVDGESVLAHQPAQAAAQRQPADPRVGDGAAGRGEPERLRLVIQLAPEHAALRPGRAGARVHVDALHGGQVDDQATVVGAVARRPVTAAAHGHHDAGRPCEVDRLLHIGDAGAARDERRPAVDVAVPHAPGGLVAAVVTLDHLAAQRAPEAPDVSSAEGAASPIRRDCRDRRHVVSLAWPF